MGSFLCFGSFSLGRQHTAGLVRSWQRRRGNGGLPSSQTHCGGVSLLTQAPTLLPTETQHRGHLPEVLSAAGLSLPAQGLAMPYSPAPALGVPGASVRRGSHP